MLLRAYRDGTSPVADDGWLATGDVGAWDDDGRLVVHGRAGDVVVTGGEKVWPTPVEEALRTHPAVADVAVAGRPDDEWGQRVVAWVVASEGAEPPTLDALRDHVRSTLPAYAAPRELRLVTELPRTALGKIRRNLL
jgi:o-succinylbenzoate---CoA ligase